MINLPFHYAGAQIPITATDREALNLNYHKSAQMPATCENLKTIQCLDAGGEGLNSTISNELADLSLFVRCLCNNSVLNTGLVNMVSVTHYLYLDSHYIQCIHLHIHRSSSIVQQQLWHTDACHPPLQ